MITAVVCCQLIVVTAMTDTVTMAGVCWQEPSVTQELVTLHVSQFGLSGATATMIVLTSRMRLTATEAPSTQQQQLLPVSLCLRWH